MGFVSGWQGFDQVEIVLLLLDLQYVIVCKRGGSVMVRQKLYEYDYSTYDGDADVESCAGLTLKNDGMRCCLHLVLYST